jgi:DNA-binding NtrC family response regulator
MKNNKILIIDNDEGIQFAFHSIVQKEGYNGVKAMNGRTALELLKNDNFCGILLELNLPDMDGLNVLELIRDFEPRVPVVIITGMRTPQSIKRSAELGVIEFLEKPVSLAKMREILHKIKYNNK